MKNKILSHIDLKILSLVIAILVWVVVANVDDYKTTKQISGIEIEFINGSAITERNKVYEVPEGTTIDVIVKGRRSVVENLSRDDFKAVADLSKMSVTNAVIVEVSALRSAVDKEISIAYTNNAVIVEVEDKVEKQFPITVRANSSVAEGYAISNKTATPNLITVKGAESVVNTIEQVIVNVNVSRAKETITAIGEPVFLNYSGEAIDLSKIEYDVSSVEVTVDIQKTKELRVNVKTKGEPKSGYVISSVDYQPTTILVVGDTVDLARVEEILIDDVDVTGSSDTVETSVQIADYLPSGITLAQDVEEIMIKVLVEKVRERTMTIRPDDINIIGEKNGYEYIISEDEPLEVQVSGLKETIDNLQVHDLIPNIDVSDYGVGTHEIVLGLRDMTGVTIDGDCVVEVEIKRE